MKENTLLETKNFYLQKAIKLEIANAYGYQETYLRVSEIITIQLPAPGSRYEVNGEELISQTAEDIFKVVPESKFLKYTKKKTKRCWWFRKDKVTDFSSNGKDTYAVKVGGKFYEVVEREEYERLLEEIEWEIENPSNP